VLGDLFGASSCLLWGGLGLLGTRGGLLLARGGRGRGSGGRDGRELGVDHGR